MHTPAEGFEVAGEEEKCTQCKERDLLCAVQVKHTGHATEVGLCWNDDCWTGNGTELLTGPEC